MALPTKLFADLDEWFIYNHPGDGLVICGTVFGHARIQDGHHLVSTSIVKIDKETAETRNTYYSLGNRLTELNPYWTDRFRAWGMHPSKVLWEEQFINELMSRVK